MWDTSIYVGIPPTCRPYQAAFPDTCAQVPSGEVDKVAKGEQWTDAETAEVEEEDVSWITPTAGATVKGTLTRAFLVKQSDGKLTCGYRIEQEEGGALNVGERFFFKDAIRGVNLGTKLEITFTEEKPLKKNRTQWLGKFRFVAGSGKGPNVLTTLKADYEKRYAEDGADAIPF